MTEAPKTVQLTPAEWRQQCLFSVAQLHDFLSSVPPQAADGTSALTADVLAQVDAHIARGRSFLRAWQLSRAPGVSPVQPVVAQPKANGAHDVPKRRGGWPKGKKRTPRVQQSSVQ